MEVGPERCVSFPPLGMMPSFYGIDRNTTGSLLGFKDHYQINEWMLMGEGDILLLHTDGLVNHENDTEGYFPGRLERTLRDAKQYTASEIFEAITTDLLAFGPAADDISLVVIKRT